MLHSAALFLAKNTEKGFPPRSLPLAGARLHCVPRWIALRSIQIVLQLLKTLSTLPIYKFTYMHEQAHGLKLFSLYLISPRLICFLLRFSVLQKLYF